MSRRQVKTISTVFLALAIYSLGQLYSVANAAGGQEITQPPYQLHGVFAAAKTLTFTNGQSVPLVIEYGKEIDTTSFSAALNGEEVSADFFPNPGATEKVQLPFKPDKEYRLRIIASNRGSNHPLVKEWQINFSQVGAVPLVRTHTMSKSEMARLKALMKQAEEQHIPAYKRDEFLRQHGFP